MTRISPSLVEGYFRIPVDYYYYLCFVVTLAHFLQIQNARCVEVLLSAINKPHHIAGDSNWVQVVQFAAEKDCSYTVMSHGSTHGRSAPHEKPMNELLRAKIG